MNEESLLIDEELVKLEGSEEVACFSEGHPSLLLLLMQLPVVEAAHLFAQHLSAEGLLEG